MRLDKYISITLGISRSDSKKIIKSKKVKVNNIIVSKSDIEIIDSDIVTYNEKRLNLLKEIYIMMNKPKDYVCALNDNLHKTVMDLLGKEFVGYSLSIVGRLDKDTTGLLLITSDGEFNHRLTSPKYNCLKKYYVEVDCKFQESDIVDFKNGVIIIDKDDKEYHTKSAILEIITDYSAYITISEGKFHQVKKMCKSIGKNVIELKRVKIGDLELDQGLKEGEYRLLKEDELQLLNIND